MAIVAAVAVAAGLMVTGHLTARHDIRGLVSVGPADDAQGVRWRSLLDNFSENGTIVMSCAPEGRLADFNWGADVYVRDGAGTVIGKGSLGSGVLHAGATAICEFTFTIADVPEVPFYTFEIADRTGDTYSLDDLKGKGWIVGLSAGL